MGVPVALNVSLPSSQSFQGCFPTVLQLQWYQQAHVFYCCGPFLGLGVVRDVPVLHQKTSVTLILS